ncbi:MAG TPA: metallophosphoesterase, partial [Polyangia bacterium]|nr:metallophosphoesterase [Polyangia bacterium]
LQPDTTYCYTVYQDGAPATAPAPLQTAPAPGTARPFQFVAFGDSGGGGSDQQALLKQIETVPFDFMIHVGDIAYDHGLLPEFELHFFNVYAPLLAARPIFPASGNHEYDTADAQPFREVFALPENGGPDGVERWYSYDWGEVHFVVLDTERSGAAQAAWLEADLAANKLPWTIVYGHRPPHSSGEHGDDPGFNQWFVPILTKFHVPLVLSGHDHDYERFQPIDGVTYIVTGGGGKGVYELKSPEAGSAFADSVIHFLVVTVDDDTLTTHAIDGTGREFDTTTIHR